MKTKPDLQEYLELLREAFAAVERYTHEGRVYYSVQQEMVASCIQHLELLADLIDAHNNEWEVI